MAKQSLKGHSVQNANKSRFDQVRAVAKPRFDFTELTSTYHVNCY